MKKLFFYFFLLVFTNLSYGNPVAFPQAFISELKFEAENIWMLEITFKYSHPYRHSDFDSICVVTSGGSSRIRMDNIKDSTLLFVITSDSLTSPLVVNRQGDFIKICSYLNYWESSFTLEDSLVFGNYLGSSITSLPLEYSICRMEYNLYCKDKSPTIGLENDTLGTCGTLIGKLFDKEYNPVTTGNYELDNTITFKPDGKFYTSVYARKFVTDRISEVIAPGYTQTIAVDSLGIDMNPDSLVVRDIHFKYLIVDVEDIKPVENYKLELINYPNPFNSSTNFFVKISSELRYNVGRIDIYNINGERIYSISLSNNSLPRWEGTDSNGEAVSSGIYYYRLILDSTIYKNGSMVLLK